MGPTILRKILAYAALLGVAGAPAGQGTASPRPNILIAISDNQSWPHPGMQAVRTPAFDRVARSGVHCTNSIAPSSGCSPSRAALLTGRHHWMIGEAGTHRSGFPTRYLTFPDLLEKAGYWIGATGKLWGPGDWKASGRTRNPVGPEYQKHTLQPPTHGISPNDYAANFQEFLDARPSGKPYFFWFGCQEPRREYEPGSGARVGKKRLEDVAVPSFLPDCPEIRSELLDYALEVEWFDAQLARFLDLLEKRGELANTLIIVTSDNGYNFPHAGYNLYEYGIHMPLALAWPARIPGGRTVEDLIGHVDVTATILEAAGVDHPAAKDKALAPVGRSLLGLLASNRGGVLDPSRTMVFSGRERHSSARYNNLGYPARAVRTADYLYIRNFHPERWPAGDPQELGKDKTPGPMHGAYFDIDPCPTLDFLVKHRDDPKIGPFFHLAVDKRPSEELFDIRKDPGCTRNLAREPAHAETARNLRDALDRVLRETGDPRLVGPDPEIWETYPRYGAIRTFPPPP